MTDKPISDPPARLRQRFRARKSEWRIWWEPEAAIKPLGFAPVELDASRLTWSVREAKRLNSQVERARRGDIGAPAAKRKTGKSLAALIHRYMQSPEFVDGLAVASQRSYRKQFHFIENHIGEYLVARIDKPRVRGWYEEVYVKSGASMGHAFKRHLSLLFTYAENIGWAEFNPCQGLRVTAPPPRNRVLTWEEIDALIEAAEALDMHDMALAIRLGIYQGQRATDIAKAAPGHFEDGIWKLKRSKRGNTTRLTLHPEIAHLVAARKATANNQETLLVDGQGRPLHVDGRLDRFTKAFAKARAEAAKRVPSVATAWFKDLRRTFATMAREAGASGRDIADALGNKSDINPTLSQTYMPPHIERGDTRGQCGAAAIQCKEGKLMSCGACNSDAFKANYNISAKANCVFGYAYPTGDLPLDLAVRRLYFMGASYVCWDTTSPIGVNVAYRPAMARLLRLSLREGDALLVSSLKALGDRPSRQNVFIERLASLGVTTFHLTQEETCACAEHALEIQGLATATS